MGMGRVGWKSKAIGFYMNTGWDVVENHKASQPVFNVGPSWGQQNGVSLVGRSCILHSLRNASTTGLDKQKISE